MWCFECERCKCKVQLCTRCLRGRRYCQACSAEIRRAKVREAGRKYQRTAKGRRRHLRRSRRFRRRQGEQQPARRPELIAESERGSAAPPATVPTPPAPSETDASATPAAGPPCVTHQPSRPEGCPSAMVGSALMAAASMVASRGGAEAPRDEERRAEQDVTGRHDGEGEAQGAAHGAPAQPLEAQPIRARCACCGRVGELVLFDGQPRVVRGGDPG